MTLIDKLNEHKETIALVLRGTEKQSSHEFTFLGHYLLGLHSAIDIVREHKCIWKGVYDHSEESTHYTLSCGNEYFDNYMGEDVDIFKYCPYCGGEIEFNEVKL